MRRAEKVALRAVFTPSEGKNKKGKNAVMGQKCTFSTLISVGKSKKNIQKAMGKVDEISEYPERKNAGKTRQEYIRKNFNTFIINCLQGGSQ